jgi:hypothetical protein
MNENTVNRALLRMRKAHETGRGVRLSWEELNAMSVELIGQWWRAIDENGENTEARP